MRLSPLLVTLAVLAPTAPAQDAATGAAAMPNPKAKEHDALKQFVGTWTCSVKITEGGQAFEMPATENFELLCNGLWLKSTVTSTFQGQPFSGVSLMGWEPKMKAYTGVWTDSMGPTASLMSATYDPKTRTFTSKTTSGQGPTRSTTVFKDNDTIVETGYKTGADGKETVVMEITRKRGAGAPPTPTTEPAGTKPTASGKPTAPAGNTAEASKGTATPAGASTGRDPVQEALTRHVGKWNTVSKMATPDGKTTEEAGTETCSAVCGGQWLWTDYNATFMGGPFEGHALVGYDPTTKKVTTYWVDSLSPYLHTLTGTYDAKTKTLTASGKIIDPAGEEGTMTETTTWKDEHTRHSTMTCTGKEGSMSFEVTYTRAQQEGAYKIK